MKNEIDWEGEARDWLMARGLSATNYEGALARFLKATAEIHADARAEEIAKAIRYIYDEGCKGTSGNDHLRYGLLRAYDIARSFITKPKTREEALEEALLAAVKRLQWHAQKLLENDEITEAAIYKASANEVEQASRKALAWKDTDRQP